MRQHSNKEQVIIPKRQVLIWNNSEWVETQMKDLNVGDIFKMNDPDGTPVIDDNMFSAWVVTEEPKYITNEHGVETWGVEADPYPMVPNPTGGA